MILPDAINLELRKLSDDALVKIKDKLKAKIVKLKPDSAENLIYGPIYLEIESLLTTKKPFEEITFTPYAKPAEDELVKIVSKISTTPLISEEVTTLINFVSAHSSTNYSAKILQGKETFNDLEASNLLLVEDRYGNTISDYLISCINKYSTADKFTTTSALLAALCNGVDGARRSTPEYAAHSRAPQPQKPSAIYRSLDPKAIRSTLSSHRPYSHPLYNLSSTLVPSQQAYALPAHYPPVYYPADPAQQKEAFDAVMAKVKLLEGTPFHGSALHAVLKYHIDYSNELGMARAMQILNLNGEYDRIPRHIAKNVLRPFRLKSTFKTLLNSLLKLKNARKLTTEEGVKLQQNLVQLSKTYIDEFVKLLSQDVPLNVWEQIKNGLEEVEQLVNLCQVIIFAVEKDEKVSRELYQKISNSYYSKFPEKLPSNPFNLLFTNFKSALKTYIQELPEIAVKILPKALNGEQSPEDALKELSRVVLQTGPWDILETYSVRGLKISSSMTNFLFGNAPTEKGVPVETVSQLITKENLDLLDGTIKTLFQNSGSRERVDAFVKLAIILAFLRKIHPEKYSDFESGPFSFLKDNKHSLLRSSGTINVSKKAKYIVESLAQLNTISPIAFESGVYIAEKVQQKTNWNETFQIAYYKELLLSWDPALAGKNDLLQKYISTVILENVQGKDRDEDVLQVVRNNLKDLN
jgi:hypothetical protein